jgi:hypothetical protein
MTLPIHTNPAEYDPTYRPPALTAVHHYNLQNQSWGIPRKHESAPSVFTFEDPIDVYFGEYTLYPSNSELVWPGMQFQPVEAGTAPFERIFPNLYKESFGSGEKASKGYFIIDLLDRGASRAAALTANFAKYSELSAAPAGTFSADITKGGAKIVYQFAGRVFYAGFSGELEEGDERSPSLSNSVVYSQLIRNKQDIVKCYQEGDPTSRENSDIVDTDGGFFKIADAGTIIGFGTIDETLIVLADNGVWAVNGGSDYGFTPTNYKVSKVSNHGVISQQSIVSFDDFVAYWSKGGIFVIKRNQEGKFVPTNLTETTIKTFYDNIPLAAKQSCQGIFNGFNKTLRWIYEDSGYQNANPQLYINRELVFDTTFNAFTKNRIYDTPFFGDPSIPYRIPVSFFTPQETERAKYVIFTWGLGVFALSFGDYIDERFKDWGTYDAYAFLVTGQQTGGDSSATKQMPYLTVNMTRTETGVDEFGNLVKPSGCLFQTHWDWYSTSFYSSTEYAKLSKFQQAYKLKRVWMPATLPGTFNDGLEVVTTKNKVRGRGKAFSVYFRTEPEKDCQLLGWNLNLNGNQIT